MHSYVLGLQEVDSTMLMEVGGKGLNLAELSRIEGLRVPDGFCITTEAYKKIVGNNERYNALLNQLITLTLADRDQIQEISGAIRNLIEGDAVQEEIQYEISRWHTRLGDQHAYAIRSSATSRRPAFGFICRPAGYVFEHYRIRFYLTAYKQMLGFTVYGTGSHLPQAKRIRSP